ncbi:hypothetical protein ACFQ7A_12945 [Streptomyces sp. NPDC056528]|uniref:hypothetical protein n=1 Tax=Streptomyces sp. NPDC056528 TaxID=3345854 RepID=UPI00368EA190
MTDPQEQAPVTSDALTLLHEIVPAPATPRRKDWAGLDPDRWTVMVNEARGPGWEHFSVSCTRFLAASLSGTLRSGLLSSSFPRAPHEFRRLGPARRDGKDRRP